MANVFEDFSIEWAGDHYVIPANRLLKTIAAVEQVVTYGELIAFASRRTAPFATLAGAYGVVLRSAGAFVSDDDVYAGMFGADVSSDHILDAINGLFALMTPPGLKNASSEAPKPGNSQRAPAKGSSKPSSKRSSVKAG